MRKLKFETTAPYMQGYNSPAAPVWAGRIAAIVALGAAILHFDENPVAITIIIIALILLLLFTGYAKIKVYEDRFEYLPASPVILWLKGKTTYHLSEVHFVNVPVEYEVKNLPPNKKYLNNIDSGKKMHIAFKNGTNDLLSDIRRDQLLMAAIAINKQIKNLREKTIQ